MTANRQVLDADLHAFVDGEADEDLRKQVQSYLTTNIEAARRVSAWTLQGDALREAFPLPGSIRQTKPAQNARGWKTHRLIYLLSLLLAFMTGLALAVTLYIFHVSQPQKITGHSALERPLYSKDLRGS